MSIRCAVAADTKLETPEGPLTVKTVGNTPTAVMTRLDDGTIRFAMTTAVRRLDEAPRPVLRIVLDSGRALRVGAEQELLTRDQAVRTAGSLRPGDELLSAFAFPAGYEYVTDDGRTVTSSGTVTVVSVEPAGEAEVWTLQVPRTGRFVFSAGVVGVAE